MRIMFALGIVALAGGCAGTDWNRNIYEGIRQQQKQPDASGDVKPRATMPDYDQYRRERDAARGSRPE